MDHFEAAQKAEAEMKEALRQLEQDESLFLENDCRLSENMRNVRKNLSVGAPLEKSP